MKEASNDNGLRWDFNFQHEIKNLCNTKRAGHVYSQAVQSLAQLFIKLPPGGTVSALTVHLVFLSPHTFRIIWLNNNDPSYCSWERVNGVTQ